MKMKPILKIIVLMLPLSILQFCETAKTTSIFKIRTPLSETEKVEVLGANQTISNNAELLGHVKIADSGITTKCTYDIVIKQAITQARSIGGNILVITKHQDPATFIGSPCHRIWADVYYLKP
jgi:hypothetical protein